MCQNPPTLAIVIKIIIGEHLCELYHFCYTLFPRSHVVLIVRVSFTCKNIVYFTFQKHYEFAPSSEILETPWATISRELRAASNRLIAAQLWQPPSPKLPKTAEDRRNRLNGEAHSTSYYRGKVMQRRE